MSTTASPRRLAGRFGALFSLFLVAALAVPVSAQASWSVPVTLSAAGQSAAYPQVAVDQSGNAVFVWQRRDSSTDCDGTGCYRIQARIRSTAGTLSPVQTLSAAGGNATLPQVAVDQSGNAVFVWQRRDPTTGCPGGCLRIQARARSAAGSLSPTQTLTIASLDAVSPEVAVDSSGNAVFVWYSRGVIRARTRSATGTLSPTEILSGHGTGSSSPQVGVDQDGDAVFVWQRTDETTDCNGSGCIRIEARASSAAGVLSATQILSTAGKDAFNPQVGVDQQGDAVFVWERYDGRTGCGDLACYHVQARARSAAGVLSATQTLSYAKESAFFPQVGVDQGGDAVFVWEQEHYGTDCAGCILVEARARSAAGTLSAVQTLSVPGENALYPQVGVDQGGDAVFVWEHRDETTDCSGVGCFRTEAGARSAAGLLGTIQTLSAAGQHAAYPQVGIDQSGDAVAVWQRDDGTAQCGGAPGCSQVQAAVGP
jgi:uncharacterized protein YheU (UPF0270 family)